MIGGKASPSSTVWVDLRTGQCQSTGWAVGGVRKNLKGSPHVYKKTPLGKLVRDVNQLAGGYSCRGQCRKRPSPHG
jgi:hypothetical protein